MKKLLIIAAVLAVIAALLLGYLGYTHHYNSTHIFVEDAVYPKNAEKLDLRGTGISQEHYESVRAQLPGCEILWDVPIQGRTVENTVTELSLKGLAQADLQQLKYFHRQRKNHSQPVADTGAGGWLPRESDHRTLSDLCAECTDAGRHG